MLTKNIAFIFLFTVLIYSKEVRLTCQTSATSECASGYKFRMIGASLDAKYCLPVGSTCNVMYDNTLQTITCIRDYKYGICTTGVCYYAVNIPVCSKDLTCTSIPDNYQYSCTNCAVLCPKCFNSIKNGQVTASQVCIGNLCTVKDANATVTKCNNNVDALGFGCSCCVTANQNVTMCTSSNQALSIYEFTSWAIGGDIININSTKLEINTQCIVLIILAIFVLIL